MSKRRYNSQSAESAPEDLVKHLKAAANDEVLLREIIENSDIVSITAAFAALLSGGTSDAVNDAKHRKKTRNRPCRSAPNETLVEILLFADRDTLDSMQLVCHFMLNFIRDREAGELPLRSFSEVNIGKFRRPQFASNQWKDYCLPFGVLTVSETGKELFSDAVSELVPYLRLAYCVEINVDIRWTCSEPDERRGAGYGLLRSIFDDLVVPNTFVNVVTVYVDEQSAIFALRVFEAFKLLNKAVVRVDKRNDHWKTSFNEAFFASTAECGVRTIYFDSGIRSTIKVDLWAALSFGFAEPTTGGHRNISGVLFELDGNYVFKQLLERASELDGSQRVDFKFTISSIMLRTDPAGFEKYRKDAWSWAWTTSRTASR